MIRYFHSEEMQLPIMYRETYVCSGGEPGESAVIRVNGEEASIATPIHQNDVIEIDISTKGKPGSIEIQALPEYKSAISFYVNGTKVDCPCFVSANGAIGICVL